MSFPSVASVLLVAVEARHRELAPWLRVVGEPVRYRLELIEPESVPSRGPWNVIVVDGDSIPSDDTRDETLRMMSQESLAAVLYIANRLPSKIELAQAFAWASDTIEYGWDFGDRLRRRVQSIALAPWRASTALRMEAERLGDRRLRVVSPVAFERETILDLEAPRPRVRRADPSLPFALAQEACSLGGRAPQLVARSFHEGRRVGVASVKEDIDLICESFMDDLYAAVAALPERVGERLVAAAEAVSSVRHRLGQVARDELAAIERHESRPL